MKITKKIIKIGHCQGIILDRVILNNMKLKLGDYVDISDMIKVEKKRKNGIQKHKSN